MRLTFAFHFCRLSFYFLASPIDSPAWWSVLWPPPDRVSPGAMDMDCASTSLSIPSGISPAEEHNKFV